MLNEASNKFTSRRVLLRFMQILRKRCVDVPTMQPAAHATSTILFMQSHAAKFSRLDPLFPIFAGMQKINTILEAV